MYWGSHEPPRELAKRLGENMRALHAGQRVDHLVKANVKLFCNSVAHDAALLERDLRAGRVNMGQYRDRIQELRDMSQYISSALMDVEEKRGEDPVYSNLQLQLESKAAQLERLLAEPPKKSRWRLRI